MGEIDTAERAEKRLWDCAKGGQCAMRGGKSWQQTIVPTTALSSTSLSSAQTLAMSTPEAMIEAILEKVKTGGTTPFAMRKASLSP